MGASSQRAEHRERSKRRSNIELLPVWHVGSGRWRAILRNPCERIEPTNPLLKAAIIYLACDRPSTIARRGVNSLTKEPNDNHGKAVTAHRGPADLRCSAADRPRHPDDPAAPAGGNREFYPH